ncbi:MAG: AAA family ATPase [bacterium]
MPQHTKTFRVFVSSTFSDMKEERRILQKNVFPKLEKFCESNGAKFQAVDLRWGVNEESQLNQKTIDICLNEIARCQRISPKPNFLILLGDRYGWQPIPTKIPDSEMLPILKQITDEQKDLLEAWYKLDQNAIPFEFVLQPRGKEYEEYSVWQNVETEIREILRTAVAKLKFTPQQLGKYYASATHQEIIHGALNPPKDAKKPEEHVLALLRDTEGLPDDKSAMGFIDLKKDDEPDEYCREQLAALKMELKTKLGDHCLTYSAKWNNGKSEISDPAEFEKTVFNFLKDIIEQQIKEVITPDEINHEIKLHAEFKEKLTEHFCGREEILDKIKSYLNSSERKVLSIIGDSGSGKSSVMAQAVKEWQIKNGNAVTVYRFIGTTSSSSNIISLLQSICGQVARAFNVELISLAGEGKDKTLYEMNGLTEILRKCLALGTTEKPVVIFLDALDQLSDSDNAKALYWIPRELPEHAKFIVSALPELDGRLNQTVKEHLPVLPVKEARLILDRWFDVIDRILTVKQYKEVIENFGKTGLPIYLKLAFEKAKHWHSYDENITLQDTVPGIINDFIDTLEEEHTKEFVEHVICYMLSGRYQGLAENEILEILVFDEDYWKNKFLPKTHPDHRAELEDVSKIPIVVWSRFFLDMEPFLTERDADGVPIITFFHRQFNEVLRTRYKLDEKIIDEK